MTWHARVGGDGLGTVGKRGGTYLGPCSRVLQAVAVLGDVALGRLAGVRIRGRRGVPLVLVRIQVTANPPWLGPSTGIQQGGSTTMTTAGGGRMVEVGTMMSQWEE